MSTAIQLSDYRPAERACQQNPFPYYALMRKEAPVHLHEASGIYFISRYSTINKVLTEPNLFSSRGSNQRTEGSSEVADGIRGILADGWPQVDTMLTADPPVQTRYRKAIGRPFGPRRIKEFEPLIRKMSIELIEAWPQEGVLHFNTAFAMPLPIRAISHALSMAPDLEANIKRWSDDSVASLGTEITDERRIEAARGVVESQKYWVSRFDEARRNPIDDIVSNLVNTDFEDHTGTRRKLDDPELISMMRQFMVAGNETTTKLLNQTLRLLIENPTEWQRIKDDPSMIPAMVEESLRLSSPNQGLFRRVTEDTELEGVKLPKGARLWVIFASANRDEEVFPDPDRFDPTRKNVAEHVAFGKGTHLCPGAPLSRLETCVSFEEIVRHTDSFEFAPDYRIEYEPSYILRGLTHLDVLAKRRA
jgi:cytochrome P450